MKPMDVIKKMWFKSFILLPLLLLLLLVMVAGCAPQDPAPPEPEPEPEEQVEEPQTEWEAVTLYYADEQSDRLVEENRSLALEGREPAVTVLEELIEGPDLPAHGRTIPADVKVLGVQIKDGIAIADFSEELRSSHWGGSTGEIITVYSIVNTLAELPGVEQVQILIEGEKVDTLVGHLELMEPLSPDWGLVAP